MQNKVNLFLDNRNSFKTTVLYIVSALLVYLLMVFACQFQGFPKPPAIAQFDAGWYKVINLFGYEYTEGKGGTTGFFPLFPYVWRWLNLGDWGIVIFNSLVYFIAIAWLTTLFGIQNKAILIFLALPSALFYYLPFTESLFFLFSVMFLAGFENKSYLMVFTGLFLASLTKSTTLFFIPAIAGMELCFGPKFNWLSAVKTIFWFCLPVVLGIAIVLFIQYEATGTWFAFVKAQRNGWGHTFKWPVLPFTTADQGRLIWLDGLAFIVGIFAAGTAGILFFRKLTGKAFTHDSRPYLFSVFILTAMAFYGVFFQVQTVFGTELVSMNRYVFCVPFFILFFYFTLKHTQLNRRFFLVTFAVLVACFCLLGMFHSTQLFKAAGAAGNVLYFSFVAIAFYGAILSFKLQNTFIFLVFFILSLVTQVLLLSWFAMGKWIG